MLEPKPGVSACCLSLILTGCGLAKINEINTTYNADLTSCTRRFPNELEKPVTPRNKCIGEADLRLNRDLSKYQPINMDLILLHNSSVLVASERYDKGITSEAQYQQELAKALVNFKSALAQRNNAAQIAEAAQQQANAVSLAAQPIVTNPTKSVSCSTILNQNFCN